MADFEAQISKWVAETQERMDAVVKESVQEVVSEMQRPVAEGGNMPVDTGFLRASLQSGINERPNITLESRPEGSGAFGEPAAVNLDIARLQAGDVFYAGYGANYAIHQEFGTEKFSGRGFVRKAAQQWQAIVSRVSRQARRRAKGL